MRALILCLALCLAGPDAAAADPAADPVFAPTRIAAELRAIGRIRDAQATSGGCSAVLIAPALAITAAHCARREQPALMNPPMLILGPDRSPPLFRIRIVAVSHHVAHGQAARSIDTIHSDLALLHLEAPVPADIATPIPLAEPPDARQVAIYGYANRQGDVLSGHPTCQLGLVRPALLGSDCTVIGGYSGTAVLSGPPGDRRLEGIAVARVSQPPLRALIADVVPWPQFTDGTPAPRPPQ